MTVKQKLIQTENNAQRWTLYHEVKDDADADLVLEQILYNARGYGEVQKVYHCARSKSMADKALLELSKSNKQDPPEMSL